MVRTHAHSRPLPDTVAKLCRLFRTIMSTAVDDGLLQSNAVAIAELYTIQESAYC